MRICHAFIFFSIKFAGGTSDLMYKICKAQVKVGLQPIVYSGEYKFDQELASMLPGVEFRVLRSWLDGAGFSIMPGLFRLARKELPDIDIVHMHVFRTFQNIVLYYYCRRYNVPYVIDAHGAVPYHTRKRLIKRIFDRLWGPRMLHDAARIIAETEVGVTEYVDVAPDLDRTKITVLSPPFDTEEFENLPSHGAFRERFGITAPHVIMFLGRIHEIKGNDFLIQGFAELAKRRDDVQLVLVGPDDGHMDVCKSLAEELGVADKVLFAGFLFAEDKVQALVDADIVAQLSRHEQGAWAPFEAVLCGTPIIVTQHTGAGEDVRRIDAGYLVEFGNVGQLADRIEHILKHRDEAQSKTLTAKNFIEENLSMKSRVHEYTELYQECIAERRGQGQ